MMFLFWLATIIFLFIVAFLATLSGKHYGYVPKKGKLSLPPKNFKPAGENDGK